MVILQLLSVVVVVFVSSSVLCIYLHGTENEAQNFNKLFRHDNHHDIKNVLSHIEIKILSAAPEKICDAPVWAFKCVGRERGVEKEKKICWSWFARRVIISIEQPTFLLAPLSLCIGRALSKSSLTFVNLYCDPLRAPASSLGSVLNIKATRMKSVHATVTKRSDDNTCTQKPTRDRLFTATPSTFKTA